MPFTIDSDTILTVHDMAPAPEPDTVAVTAEKDLKKATADWPITRLVEIWNGFAGVVPLGGLKPVKKFTDRATALKRIWGAMQRLAEHFNEEKQSRPAPKSSAAGRRGRKATAATQTPAETATAVTPAASRHCRPQGPPSVSGGPGRSLPQ